MKIVHVGQYHRVDDSRIFRKECISLAENGYQVVYITSDFQGKVKDHEKSGVKVKIYPYGPVSISGLKGFKTLRRFAANIRRLWMAYQYVKAEQPDIVHIHEYELLYLIALFKIGKRNTRIIYDVHEDTPRHYGRYYCRRYGETAGKIAEKKYEITERFFCRLSDAVIVVTPHIYRLLKKYNRYTIQVCNFPVVKTDSDEAVKEISGKDKVVSFGGGLSKENGISMLMDLADLLHGQLMLAGSFAGIDYHSEFQEKYKDEIKAGKIVYRGYLTQEEMEQFYRDSYLGVAIYKNTPNCYNAYPIKMFEYMAAGIPVVISDFPGIRKIIKETGAGILVNPEAGEEIVKAVNRLLDNPDLAAEMGRNGRKAALSKYNWSKEEKKLLDLYDIVAK